jgi:hypothetical protein
MHGECVTPDAADLALALAETAARHELALGGGTACALRVDTVSAATSTSSLSGRSTHPGSWKSSQASNTNGYGESHTPG